MYKYFIYWTFIDFSSFWDFVSWWCWRFCLTLCCTTFFFIIFKWVVNLMRCILSLIDLPTCSCAMYKNWIHKKGLILIRWEFYQKFIRFWSKNITLKFYSCSLYWCDVLYRFWLCTNFRHLIYCWLNIIDITLHFYIFNNSEKENSMWRCRTRWVAIYK